MSAKKSLDAYYARQLREIEREQRPRRKNKSPEADLKREVLRWLTANGFSCHSVESKAVYSRAAGRYISGQVTAGFSDIAGACPDGVACFIELKAPGRLNTLRDGQREFLMAKIAVGCFACVVDSVALLAELYVEFAHRRAMEPQLAKAYLLRHVQGKV